MAYWKVWSRTFALTQPFCKENYSSNSGKKPKTEDLSWIFVKPDNHRYELEYRIVWAKM